MSVEQYIYTINDLTCSYYSNLPVLKVPRLKIARGKLVMLLGKSGSGKSTLLETLGLMNNTIQSGDILFSPIGKKPINIKTLWSNSSSELRASLRSKEMSFIFQNTNLMPNFSVIENILAAHQIKGISKDSALPVIRETMRAVGIDELEHINDVTRLSGGQRQRIAFVRAISSPFEVIFGDEPTGNLDEFNSNELMRVLRNKVVEQSKTAIIVTHNLEMATEFADVIIVITRSSTNDFGEIISSNIFYRENTQKKQTTWMNEQTGHLHCIKDVLYNLLSQYGK